MDRQPIISAKDVEITFSLRGRKLNAIRKCSLDLYEGETLAIVGESGSGKSVFTKNFVGMLDANGKITGGSIMYEGRDMTKFTEKDWLGVRGKKIAMVMQDPMTSLNPLKKIGKQIQESIEHHQGLKGEEAKKAAIEMLGKVGIPDPERRVLRRYASACRHCHCSGLPPADPDLRRAHHCIGRDHSGTDPAADPRPAEGAGHVRYLHHP